ncbi:uncharacterized domain 1-containing protein [Roseivivax halotolerans]|uniref:Uncharacterized domain 1-containing protein n=1 Tax=Roseivivax halotolerans TaxID=93684 RepID=A0A1I6AH43_9RHOB|nr:PaaI family thioesterase [Roseivivax halotolerans]SFQ67877.1 uncharacterized domain 1-containing protein [Roseivivax halotolerans]
MDQPNIIELAKTIFEGQPFSRHIGAELAEITETRSVIEVALRDDLRQQHGHAHGGVLSYLADNAITFAGGVALRGDALTSEFKINYLKPGAGPLLRAVAEPLSVSGRQAVCQCRILSVDGDEETLAAVAQGTVVRASGSKS